MPMTHSSFSLLLSTGWLYHLITHLSLSLWHLCLDERKTSLTHSFQDRSSGLTSQTFQQQHQDQQQLFLQCLLGIWGSSLATNWALLITSPSSLGHADLPSTHKKNQTLPFWKFFPAPHAVSCHLLSWLLLCATNMASNMHNQTQKNMI